MTGETRANATTADAQRQSLVRLRRKVIGHEDLNSGNGARHTSDDLVQLQYALAMRQVEEQQRADSGDRERLTEAHLGVPWHSIAVVSERVQEPHVKPVLSLVGAQLAEHRDVEFAGAKPSSPPRWDRFEAGGRVELVPAWAAIYWDAGTVSDVPLVLHTWDEHGYQVLQAFSRAEDDGAAKAYVDRLISEAKGAGSPYRGKLLKAAWAGYGVSLEILPEPEQTRDQLIFPTAIWEALDLNVHRMFARMAAFRSAGLGSNRGVLLAGAPGTGKTAACRVLARESLGPVTAIFVDSMVARNLLPQLYTEIAGLAPALLMLEDLDLIVGARHDESERWSLVDFLTVLDGLMTQHHDVVTIATTNDPVAVDAGVRRAARFDQIVHFPLPDERARERILEVYLRSIEHRVDTSRVAAETEGNTGADLREHVRAALLMADGVLETGDLLRAVATSSAAAQPEAPSDTRGKYL